MRVDEKEAGGVSGPGQLGQKGGARPTKEGKIIFLFVFK
jgi:hypothetical protein